MLFSSPWYFAFLIAVLLFLAAPLSVRVKKILLGAASCFFYAFWDYRYLGLLLLISVIDYFCAAQIAERNARGDDGPGRRLWLWVSICSNLGILSYFKYFNFFVDNLNGLLPAAAQLPHKEILLPAGISFYTFKTMSYVIDVYRRELQPARSLNDYVTFITFFPELIAGPIVRASVLLPQLDKSIGPSFERIGTGASLFLLGFTKKLMADRLGTMFDPVFADPATFSCPTAWAAVLGYSFQIYCDFSGYSDMAIGSAAMIGYQLPENFRMPYLSRDITEFWRRWHMTLSFWLRDYLYIPLGGNRVSERRTYANLMATMLLGGLWHGASWNFVIWGGLHGAALAVHRRLGRGRSGARLPVWLGIPLTFVFVSLCWIPFRCSTFAATRAFVTRLVTPSGGLSWVAPDFFVIVAVVVIGHALGAAIERCLADPHSGVGRAVRGGLDVLGFRLVSDAITGWYVRLTLRTIPGAYVALTWLLLAFLFAGTQLSPFIYFQF